MRWSRAHIPTLRESPQEAEVVSHQLMLRAGLIRRLASGIYSFLPIGKRVLQKMQTIIREEMELAGALEVEMPFVQPKEIWEQSGRWYKYGKELGRFTDRHNNEFCLQPTSEEAVCELMKKDLRSYKQLPVNVFQIQTKFRDEIRPRFGIMRGREFLMKDAYSFDLNEKAAKESYEKMRRAYRRIFIRTGLGFRAVEADSGAIGGSASEEFMVLAESGEDEIISCTKCNYAANQEKAVSVVVLPEKMEAFEPLIEFETPHIKTIDALAKSVGLKSSELLKTMIATDAEGKIIVVLLRGDHELNEIKLALALPQSEGLRLASDEELSSWGLPKGSLGPQSFPKDHVLVVDDALSMDAPYVCGANKEGFHVKNVVLSRDAKEAVRACLRNVKADELCVRCGSALRSSRGIEVGHVFYLGKKYSEPMGVKVTTEAGKEVCVEMGCYGIGVGRTVAACIEQNHDKWGIKWPVSLAPYEVGISALGDGEPLKIAEKLYEELRSLGVDVLLDDRNASPGVKLKDMDLVGIPLQVIIGDRGLKNKQFEWKLRMQDKKEMRELSQMKSTVLEALDLERKNLQTQLEVL